MMSGIVILAILLIIFISNLYVIKKNSNGATKAKLAPLVTRAWPLIGHLPVLSPPNVPHIALADLADKYGPIFTLRIGIQSLLVMSSSELTKEIFTTNDANVTARPSLVAAKYLGYEHALFPFTPGGPYWREMRKFSNLQLLSNRRLEVSKYIRIEEVETSIKELYQMWRKGGRIVEMKQWLYDLNMNVHLRMIIGKKLFDNEKERNRFQEHMQGSFHYLGMLVLRDAVPFLGWIDLGGHEKRMRKIAKELDDILGKWLDEHKKKRLYGEHKEDNDFLDSLISFLDGEDLEGYDAGTICKATCMGLISGNETVAVALTWALSLLLNNKHVLEKVQEELDTHVRKERMVNDKDINNLVYLQAVVKESLRLHPPAFIPGPRKFIEDCTIGGYHIPKDTWLMINLWKIHKDPNVWMEDPTEFKPERFLTKHKEVDVKGKHFELFPFGGGRRGCPATTYGIQMLYFTLASLLHAFEISTPNNEAVDMSRGVGLTNVKLTALEILVSPRLPSHCFEE